MREDLCAVADVLNPHSVVKWTHQSFFKIPKGKWKIGASRDELTSIRPNTLSGESLSESSFPRCMESSEYSSFGTSSNSN